MKTEAEILARIKKVEDEDWLGFERGDLIAFLSFDAAKPFLKDDADPDNWGEPKAADRDTVLTEIHEYMEFAWDKANNCRGISASRSMYHMRAWLWLIDELDRFGDILEYQYYGKPELVKICNHFGWDWRQWDNGYWRNNEGDESISADAAMGEQS